MWRLARRLIAPVILTLCGIGSWVAAGCAQGVAANLSVDTPPAFNAANRGLAGGDGYKRADNRTGQLAWAESYVMEAYLIMYEATGDTAYLDIFIDHADSVLASRDSEKGWTDYRGRSLPGWQASGHYSIGTVELRTAAGEAALFLRVSSTGDNDKTRVRISASEGRPDRFDLRIVNTENGYDETFTALTMDRRDPRYAVDVLNASRLADPWGAVRLYAEDRLAAWNGPEENPQPGEFAFTPPPYLWPVHQGRITYPLITFARFVYEDPHLQAVPRYRERADAYIEATRAVLEFLEEVWRENEAGEGWYIAERGAPIWMDGIDEPHNHSLSVGRSIIQFAALTGDPKWRDRAVKIARTIYNDLHLQANGSYTWPYWWSKGWVYRGWSPEDDVSINSPALRPRRTAEDVSHGSIEAEFAFLAYENGILFTEQDMERLARTFTQNIARMRPNGVPTLTRFVDGSGELSFYDDTTAARYLVLVDWAPEIEEMVRRIYQTNGVRSTPTDLIGVARLNWARARREQAAASDPRTREAGVAGESGARPSASEWAPRPPQWPPRISIANPAPALRQTSLLRGPLPVELEVWAAPGRSIAGVTVSVDDQIVYQGERPPASGELSVDTYAIGDGTHLLTVEAVDDRGAATKHTVAFSVANRWERRSDLDPPLQSMMGLIDRTLVHERSQGWRHAADDGAPLFGDRGRMVYEGAGPGHLVWKSPISPDGGRHRPEIQTFTVEFYVRSGDLREVLTIAVSPDGAAWTAVPFDVEIVESSGDWHRVRVTGRVDVPGEREYFRLTLMGGGAGDGPDVPAAGEIQLGAVRFGGVWR